MRDPIEEFLTYNRPFAHRHPELYRVKVARMADNPFGFFRGTFHLYARDVLDKVCYPVPALLSGGIEMPLVGDIHSENYGTYKAGDGKIYYDVNDFDETTTGRVGFDICRLATSLFLAANERESSLAESVQLVLAAVTTYTEALTRLFKKGKEYVVSDAAPSGCAAIDDLIAAAAARKRTEFIQKQTEAGKEGRKLLRSAHYFNLPDDERRQALRLLADYVAQVEPAASESFYHAEDVCGRVAGVGSMGRLRYAVLVSGKGSAEARNVLLEFKESRPSAYDLYRQRQNDAAALIQRAETVIAVQRRTQVASNPNLGFAVDGGMSFQVRELSPHDLRLELKPIKNSAMVEKVANVQATILARCHAKAASGAVGMIDPLAELSAPELFRQRVLTFSLAYADQVRQDWTTFVGKRADVEALQG